MKKLLLSFGLLMLFVLLVPSLNAQTVSGKVTNVEGEPVIGATVNAGNGKGAAVDVDGTYSFSLAPGKYTISVTFVGYKKVTKSIIMKSGEDQTLNFVLSPDDKVLTELVVVGSRNVARSSVDTPLPIDILKPEDLTSTGQNTFDKALQYRVPSFNTVQTPVNDATSLLDPYEIRNMGPSRTLILINGKRKNMSALVYTQSAPGRGETGADISAIPTNMIKRVEILRDGASAQYGSDAIAGVMNIILKDATDGGNVTLRSGITHKGDGEMIGIALNNGSKLGKEGFINYTLDLSRVGLANRPGKVSAEAEAADFGADINEVRKFLVDNSDAKNINGSPENTAAKFAVNGGFGVSDNTNLYFNAAYIYKKVNSFANYRTSYFRTTDYGLLTPSGEAYDGYQPTFDGDLNDYNATIGFKTNQNGWYTDASFTIGGNSQIYTVRNSVNRLSEIDDQLFLNNDPSFVAPEFRGPNSPINFRPGGYKFNHIVGNLDISKPINDIVSLAFGTEFRTENYEILEGDIGSITGSGADSFGGSLPENSFKVNRFNLGGYVDLAFDFTENFLVNLTGRAENYSDFGSTTNFKVSSRYKFFNDKLTLRASASNGFRAPTLHQIYLQKAQFGFTPGAGIQIEGLINNVSPQARLLGIPKLTAEKSTNITVGIGVRPNDNFNITLDYYNIGIKDRIIISNKISAGKTPAAASLDKLLADNNIVTVSFFTNAIDTRTSGIDLVAAYRNIGLGAGKLGFNLAGNYTLANELVGDIKTPKIIENAGQSVVSGEIEALTLTSRPKFKAILGINYGIGKFKFNLNNTLFGPTKFRNGGLNSGLSVNFETKVVPDISINYAPTDRLNFLFAVNNFLNVLPEWKLEAENAEGQSILDGTSSETTVTDQINLITFNGRYSQMTYDGSQFSQLGLMVNLSINLKF